MRDCTPYTPIETCKVCTNTHTILHNITHNITRGNQGTILHNIYTQYYTHFAYNLHIPYIVHKPLGLS